MNIRNWIERGRRIGYLASVCVSDTVSLCRFISRRICAVARPCQIAIALAICVDSIDPLLGIDPKHVHLYITTCYPSYGC